MDNTSIYNQKELLLKIASGDRDAFHQLYDRYNTPLYNTVRKYIAEEDTSVDLVQQVFITIWERRRTLPDLEGFDDYIFKIALNSVRRYFRVLQRQARVDRNFTSEMDNSVSDPAELAELNEYMRLWNKAVEDLPEQQQLVYRMVELQGYTTGEVSGALDISKATAKKHLELSRRAVRRAIMNSIGENGGDPANGLVLLVLMISLKIFSD